MSWALQQPLGDAAEYDNAVNGQLARIAHMRGGSKRRTTILALAEAEITPGMSRTAVFKRPDVVSAQTFYSTDKDWLHDRIYREALENVMALHVRWKTEENLRLLRERQTEFLEEEFTLGKDMLEVSKQMLARLKDGLDDIAFEDEDGRTIIRISPKWQVRDVPGFVAAMDRLLRMNLELETDRTKARHEVSGPDGGPVETAEVSDEERARRLQAGIEAARRKLMGQVAAAVVDTDEEQPLD